MASIQLTITGMHCEHCPMKVEKALKGVKGVYGVSVDLDAGSAEVDFDDKRANPEDLTGAVEAIGYGATVAG